MHGPAVAAGDPNAEVATKFGLTRYDLGIYTLVVFGLLVFILGKYAWGPMMAGLDKREKDMRQARDDAQKARDEAQRILADVQKQYGAAGDKVREMIDEARRDGLALKDRLKAEAGAEIAAERDRGKKEIETARDQALQDIWSRAVELATLISAKTIRRNIGPDDHRAMVDEALADLKQQVRVG